MAIFLAGLAWAFNYQHTIFYKLSKEWMQVTDKGVLVNRTSKSIKEHLPPKIDMTYMIHMILHNIIH